MNWNLFKKDRDLLDIFHILITLSIAVGGFFINQQQAELKQKLDRESATQTFTDKVFKQLENLNLSPTEKEAMVIDLLDIITESNISKTGELTDVERRQLMPLRIALFTDNDEILTHIGADSAKRKLWVNFAERSGNAKVKKTAIRALENLGHYGAGNTELFYSFRKILSLGQELNEWNGRLLALGALSSLVRNMDLESARGHLQKFQTDSLDLAGVYNFMFEESANVKTDLSSGTLLKSDSLNLVLSEIDEATRQLGELQGISVQMDAEAGTEQVDKLITSNIEKLTTDDSAERNSARVALAGLGENSIDALMQQLREHNGEYRIRLGVARALNLMQQPVVLQNQENIKLVVDLIGDSKAEIRKNATEFLAKLTDQGMILQVYNELKSIIRARENGNAVFNALVILETWQQKKAITSPTKEEVLAFMRAEREKLVEIKPTWRKTIERIDQVLGRNEK